MAWTVPSGYEYYDKSASKYYAAGTSLSITPAAGDHLHGVSTTLKDIYYNYYASSDPMSIESPSISNSGDNITFQLSSGWHLSLYQHTGTATSYTLLSTIGGVNVVSASISPTSSKITQINIQSDSKLQIIEVTGTTNKITKITGTMPNTLKYFCIYNSKITSVPSLANCTTWTYGFGTFQGCTALTTAPVLPSSITEAGYMFYNCTSLTTGAAIPVNCTNTSYMYYGCSKLQSAPVNNSTKLTNCAYMFYNCTSLTTASAFQIKGASTLIAERIFSGCTNLVTGPSSITNVTNLNHAFSDCTKLTSVSSLPSSVTTMESMCYKCSSLTITPDMTAVNKVTSLGSTFGHCTSLTTIHSFPQRVPNNLLSCTYTFYGCSSLTNLPILPNYIGSMTSMFSNCSSLIPQNIYIPDTVTNLKNTFSGAVNFYGVVTLNSTLGEINNTFANVAGPVIITGTNGYLSSDISKMGTNVFLEYNTQITSVEAVRCNNNGELDDNGNYIRIAVKFPFVVYPNAKLYVPKIYLKNNQQFPSQNWILYKNNDETPITIPNSYDINPEQAAELLPVNGIDLSTNLSNLSVGTFVNIIEIAEDEVLNYVAKIATSIDDVYYWNNNTSTVDTMTKIWSGTPGTAIFTSSTFIFDATPDGKSFKIGGPIDDTADIPETGFIVGNSGIIIEEDQYPSTFNGPVTINSTMRAMSNVNFEKNINILEDIEMYLDCNGSSSSSATSGEDMDLFNNIYTLGWYNDVII